MLALRRANIRIPPPPNPYTLLIKVHLFKYVSKTVPAKCRRNEITSLHSRCHAAN